MLQQFIKYVDMKILTKFYYYLIYIFIQYLLEGKRLAGYGNNWKSG